MNSKGGSGLGFSGSLVTADVYVSMTASLHGSALPEFANVRSSKSCAIPFNNGAKFSETFATLWTFYTKVLNFACLVTFLLYNVAIGSTYQQIFY